MLKTIGRALFGGSCFLCLGEAEALLCRACDADLPRLGANLCPRCALASPAGAVCGRCLTQPPAYDATQAALAYTFPADALVQSLKFRGELALAPFLGNLMLERISSRDVDCLIPVPLSLPRLRGRGYNQALEIARHVARATGIRLLPHACRKVLETAPQAELPWKERAKNVRRAFVCDADLRGQRVAVVDDVLTTGATLNELARVLHKAGAVEVAAWVVARTLPR